MDVALRVALLFFLSGLACGETEVARDGVDFTGDRERRMSRQQFEKRSWRGGGDSNLAGKRFRFSEWDHHFSSIGSRRAPVSVGEMREKEIFRTSVKRHPVLPREFSRWNSELVDLHRQAGIQMDARARAFADRKAYGEALDEAETYAATGEKLSLRELNRYQFRRNRQQGEVPVQAAGGDQ